MSNFVFEKENPEFLAVLEAVAIEKGLKKDVVNKAVESAFEVALTEYFQNLYTVIVKIRSNGAVSAFKKVTAVENVTDTYKEVLLEEAKSFDANAEIGSEVLIPLTVIGFSASIIRSIGFLINDEIVKREKEAEFAYFQKLKGFIINGTVKKVYLGSSGGVLVGIDKYEAFLAKNQMLPTEFESVKQGDKLEALVYETERSEVRPQALLTRSSEEFLFELLRQAIPEIMDETIIVKSIAREAGSRAKVAVFSKDPTVNPVLLCLSTYGRKIRALSKQLARERIDIIEWNEDPAILIVNALRGYSADTPRKFEKEGEKSYSRPINIMNITADYERQNLDVIIAEDDIRFAIGRRGQNVRLLSRLIGWSVHFITKEESSDKELDKINQSANILVNALNIDQTIAQLLIIEKLSTVEEIANASLETIANIEGFDEEIAASIQERAAAALQAMEDRQNELKAEADNFARSLSISSNDALELLKSGIKDISFLADLSTDEVVEDYKVNLPRNIISDAIMRARDGFKN